MSQRWEGLYTKAIRNFTYLPQGKHLVGYVQRQVE